MPKPVSFPFPVRPILPPNSAFGQRPLYGDFHSGIDFNSTTGAYLNTPVRAAGGGMVVESYDGNDPRDGIDSTWAKLRGTMVRINHGDGWWTRYHMLNPATNIKVGTVVRAGDIIGHVGNSGSSGTGAHLHFELWKDGVAVNPILHLKYNPAAFASASGGGATPIEDDLDAKQSAQLQFVFDAILNGGPDMADHGRSIGQSLAGIVDAVDTISTTVNEINDNTQPKTVTRSKASKATLLPADGSAITIPENQDDADTNSMVRELLARPASAVDVKPVVDAVVAAIKANPSAPVDYAAIAKAVNDDAAKRRDAWT